MQPSPGRRKCRKGCHSHIRFHSGAVLSCSLLAGSAVFSNRAHPGSKRSETTAETDATRPTTECSRKLDLLSHTEAAYGGRTASLGASLGTRWARGVVATAWNLAAVDSRMSGRQGGNDFVGRLHRVRIHRSGVIRAALIRQQSSCLPGATRRACLCSATSATPTTRTERRPCRPRR